MGILAGEKPKVHIAVCLGLPPLVRSAIYGARSVRSMPRLGMLEGILDRGLTLGIPKSKCKPSLLVDPDKKGNTSHSRKLRYGLFPELNQKRSNVKNGSGDTPLHLAFQFDYIDIVKLLLWDGADPTIKNNAQLTAAELGTKLGRGYSLGKTSEGTVAVVLVEGPERRF